MRSGLRAPLFSITATALFAVVSPSPSEALLVYSATGSKVSGSLAGEAFVDAAWSLQAIADESLATLSTFTVPGQGAFALWSLPVSPKVRIETVANVLEADLLPSGTFRWLALSGTFPVGPSPKIGFVYTTPTFQPETAAGVVNVPGSFVDLRSPAEFTGPSLFEPFSFVTSAGPLVISGSSVVTGTFRIDPVPGPLPALAVAGAFSWSRRLRGSLRRRCGS
ncbi:MAG: hypothetical protein VKP70_11595 [Cyanobacteriota bacterium]|nr:hypothetical protein [Cyanobacteriota bacterium]